MAIDPPWRLDPFQNIVNVSWGGTKYVVVAGWNFDGFGDQLPAPVYVFNTDDGSQTIVVDELAQEAIPGAAQVDRKGNPGILDGNTDDFNRYGPTPYSVTPFSELMALQSFDPAANFLLLTGYNSYSILDATGAVTSSGSLPSGVASLTFSGGGIAAIVGANTVAKIAVHSSDSSWTAALPSEDLFMGPQIAGDGGVWVGGFTPGASLSTFDYSLFRLDAKTGALTARVDFPQTTYTINTYTGGGGPPPTPTPVNITTTTFPAASLLGFSVDGKGNVIAVVGGSSIVNNNEASVPGGSDPYPTPPNTYQPLQLKSFAPSGAPIASADLPFSGNAWPTTFLGIGGTSKAVVASGQIGPESQVTSTTGNVLDYFVSCYDSPALTQRWAKEGTGGWEGFFATTISGSLAVYPAFCNGAPLI